METESLIRLARSGNFATVKDEWTRLLESSEQTPESIAQYAGVLRELVARGREGEAAELACSALEAFAMRFEASESLGGVGPILLALPKNKELGKAAADLYREAYADREGLAELIDQAGLEGGRPVRRALRTLEVCLSLEPGCFAASRDTDDAVRAEMMHDALGAIRRSGTWRAATVLRFHHPPARAGLQQIGHAWRRSWFAYGQKLVQLPPNLASSPKQTTNRGSSRTGPPAVDIEHTSTFPVVQKPAPPVTVPAWNQPVRSFTSPVSWSQHVLKMIFGGLQSHSGSPQ